MHLDQARPFNLNLENAPVRRGCSERRTDPCKETRSRRPSSGSRVGASLDRRLCCAGLRADADSPISLLDLCLSRASKHAAGSLLFAQSGDPSDPGAACVTRKVSLLPDDLGPERAKRVISSSSIRSRRRPDFSRGRKAAVLKTRPDRFIVLPPDDRGLVPLKIAPYPISNPFSCPPSIDRRPSHPPIRFTLPAVRSPQQQSAGL